MLRDDKLASIPDYNDAQIQRQPKRILTFCFIQILGEVPECGFFIRDEILNRDL